MGRGFLEVLAACGCPPGLFLEVDGTAQRESYRRLFSLTVEPLAGLLAGLLAADLAGRARAFQSMVGAGMDLAKAAGLAGLMEVEN